MEKQHPGLYKWNRRFTTLRFNMTQAGLIDYTIFVSLNWSRTHLFFLPGVNTKASATEICFLIVTCIVGVQVTLHILLHFIYMNKHKVRLSDEQIEDLPIVEGMIMDMHITPLKSKMKKYSFFIRNHSFLKQVRFLSALIIIIVG